MKISIYKVVAILLLLFTVSIIVLGWNDLLPPFSLLSISMVLLLFSVLFDQMATIERKQIANQLLMAELRAKQDAIINKLDNLEIDNTTIHNYCVNQMTMLETFCDYINREMDITVDHDNDAAETKE